MELVFEGRVTLCVPEDGTPMRVMRGQCPQHGPFGLIERYDCETDKWEVVASVRMPKSQHTGPPPREPAPRPSSPETADY